jgi:superfamily I DNA/RNA helicase
LRASEVSAILIYKHDLIIEFVNSVLEIEGIEVWQKVYDRYENIDYNNMNRYLESKGVPIMYIGGGYGSLTEADRNNKVVIMTYHSAKGLDFDYVYLPIVNSSLQINSSNRDALLLVALSRSKSGLFISYTGNINPDLGKFLGDVKPKQIIDNKSTEILF